MSKFNASKVIADGIRFDSKKEYQYYVNKLKPKLDAGAIRDLLIHPKFSLIDSFDYKELLYRPAIYTPDFLYRDMLTKKTIVDEVKGFRTADYQIRLKWFLSQRGLTYIPNVSLHRGKCMYIKDLKFLPRDKEKICRQYKIANVDFKAFYGSKFEWNEIQ
jgi:hypothetical protein